MTTEDYVKDAHLLLDLAHGEKAKAKDQELTIAEAQVHATLALVSAIRELARGRQVTYE